MRGRSRAVSSLVLLLVVAAVAACSGSGASSRGSGGMIPITDFSTVSGTWAGVAFRDVGRQDDWVEITLKDDGTFQAVSARQIGVFSGNGKLTLSDGRLTATGPRGTAVLTLYDRQGRVLRVDFQDVNGTGYTADLRPKKT